MSPDAAPSNSSHSCGFGFSLIDGPLFASISSSFEFRHCKRFQFISDQWLLSEATMIFYCSSERLSRIIKRFCEPVRTIIEDYFTGLANKAV